MASKDPSFRLNQRGMLLCAFLAHAALVLAAAILAASLYAGGGQSLERERVAMASARVRADAVGGILQRAGEDLLLLASGERTDETARRFLEAQSRLRPGVYREAAFVPAGGQPLALFLDTGRAIDRLSREQAGEVLNSPVLALPPPSSQGGGKAWPKAGEVRLIGLAETWYPSGVLPGVDKALSMSVIRLVTPVADQEGQPLGFWVLSVDGQAVRAVLQAFESPSAPLADFSAASGEPASYFLDDQGWVLFQAGGSSGQSPSMESDGVGEGLGLPAASGPEAMVPGPFGGPGMPGFPGAFRPPGAREAFWSMVRDIQAGHGGRETVDQGLGLGAAGAGRRFLGYAPVLFKARGNGERGVVVGGVAVVDSSPLPWPRDVSLIAPWGMAAVAALVAAVGLALGLSRAVARPTRELSAALRSMLARGGFEPIDLPDRSREAAALKQVVNDLIAVCSRGMGTAPRRPGAGSTEGGRPLEGPHTPGPEEDAEHCMAAGLEAVGRAPGEGESAPAGTDAASLPGEEGEAGATPAQAGLNERQTRGMAYLRKHGTMSRAAYQAVAGENVPPRTAQHDLRDLVSRGLVKVKGRGPATLYVPAEPDGEAQPVRRGGR